MTSAASLTRDQDDPALSAARVPPGPLPGAAGPAPAAVASGPRAGRWRHVGWAVLLVGAFLRFSGLNWDQTTLSHPDERHVLMTAHGLAWPESVADYLSESRSPLNPRNRGTSYFAYGTLPTTLLTGLSRAWNVRKPEDQTLLGRALAATADLLAIGWVFLLARALYARRGLAWLAAFLYAASVLPVQQAHFFVVDPFANSLGLLALWCLAEAGRPGAGAKAGGAGQPAARWGWWPAAGVALGLAASAKISALALLVPAAGWVALVGWRRAAGRPGPWPRAAAALAGMVARGGLLLAATAVTFRLAEPDAFAGWVRLSPRWLENMREVIGIASGEREMPFTLQWTGRPPLLYPAENLLFWGLGPLLGVTAVVAAGWAAWRLLRGPGRREAAPAAPGATTVPGGTAAARGSHLLPLAAAATVFGVYGTQWQMTMRYFLPCYGPLAVLAAWALCEWATPRGGARAAAGGAAARALRGLPAGLVAAATLAWAGAYLHVYAEPYTRIQASRWIAQHVPADSVLGLEHWDDNLPLSLPDVRIDPPYPTVELPWYEPETEEKRRLVVASLDEADYLVLASDKLIGSIPRLPARYPLATAYYRGLVDGRLGFKLVADFRGTMALGGFKWFTDDAEEAFSVYDHPRVRIYQKSPDCTRESLEAFFARVDLTHVDPTVPRPGFAFLGRRGPAGAGVSGKRVRTERDILLEPARWRQQQVSGTWHRLFRRHSWVSHHPIIAWVVLLAALQLVAAPYAFGLTRWLPDRGWGIARLLALAVLCWALWLLASGPPGFRVPFGRTSWWAGFGLLAAGAAALAWTQRAAWTRFGRRGWRRVLVGELIFWAGFAACLAVRSRNPDVWHPYWGGEKPMEMTYLYGVMKSDYFPPFNPWYAGGLINYYYFGFVLTGALIKATGILPAVGFNLCLATWYGLTAAAAYTAAGGLFAPGAAADDPLAEGDDGGNDEPAAAARVSSPPPAGGPTTDRAAAVPTGVDAPRPVPGRRRDRGAWAGLVPGVLASLFVVLLGNLFQGKFLAERLDELGRPDHELTIPLVSDAIRIWDGWQRVRRGDARLTVYDSDLYWSAARAIPVHSPQEVPPVTEFPCWSFLYGDLHPHLIALPFTLATLALLGCWLRGRPAAAGGTPGVRDGDQDQARARPWPTPSEGALLAVLALLLGLLWATNTWDLLTYGALLGVTLLAGRWSAYPGSPPLVRLFRAAWWAGLVGAAVGAAAYLAFWPYHAHFSSGYGAFEPWRGERTSPAAYLTVHGFFLYLLTTGFWVKLRSPTAPGGVRLLQAWLRLLRESLPGGNRRFREEMLRRLNRRPSATLAVGLLFDAGYLLALAAFAQGSLSASLALGALLTAWLAWEARDRPGQVLAYVLAGTGFVLSWAVEHWVLRGDVGRMNTVFKFYYQVWVLFALSGTVMLTEVWRRLPAWPPGWRRAWTAGLAALLAAALVYPLTAVPAKSADRINPRLRPGLDGLAFARNAECVVRDHHYDLRGDGEAIRWIQDHVEGSPVLLEMNTDGLLYSWGSRYSIHTGLPTVVGWDWHERQQQTALATSLVPARIADVQTLYRTADPGLTARLLAKYQVQLVVVGELERLYGTPEGIRKFARLGYPVIYERDGVTLYRVVPPGPAGSPPASQLAAAPTAPAGQPR